MLGAADASGGVESALLPTLPGLREKARGGAGPAVGCGGPGSPSASPRLAHTSGLLWGKGPRCCPQGTCDKSLTLMEGNVSKTLLLGRRSIPRPVNSRGGVSASTRSNCRCALVQEGRPDPRAAELQVTEQFWEDGRTTKVCRGATRRHRTKFRVRADTAFLTGSGSPEQCTALELKATKLNHSSDEPQTKHNS